LLFRVEDNAREENGNDDTELYSRALYGCDAFRAEGEQHREVYLRRKSYGGTVGKVLTTGNREFAKKTVCFISKWPMELMAADGCDAPSSF